MTCLEYDCPICNPPEVDATYDCGYKDCTICNPDVPKLEENPDPVTYELPEDEFLNIFAELADADAALTILEGKIEEANAASGILNAALKYIETIRDANAARYVAHFARGLVQFEGQNEGQDEFNATEEDLGEDY